MKIINQNHLCQIYETNDGAVESSVVYILKGIEKGEKCLCIGSNGKVVADRLIGAGVSSEALAKFITAVPADGKFLKGGSIDRAAFFNFIHDFTADFSRSGGYSGLRMCIDLGGLFKSRLSTPDIFEFETEIRKFMDNVDGISVLCQYDRSVLTKTMLVVIIKSHRYIFTKGRAIENPYHDVSEEMHLDRIDDAESDSMIEAIEALADISGLSSGKLEDSVIRSIEEIKDLYDNVPCGYHSLDKDGFVIRINNTELKWMGYARAELIGKKKITDLMTPESLLAYNESFHKFMEQGEIKDLQLDFIRKDGSVLNSLVSATAVKDGNGHFMMSRSIVYDITELKKTQEAFSKTSSLLQSLLENTSNIILVKDLDGRFLLVNDTFAKMFNLAKEDFIGKSLREFVPKIDADFIISEDRRALETGEQVEEEHKITLPDGDHSYLAVRFPLKNAKGAPYAVGVIATDITEKKRLEKIAAERDSLMKGLLENTAGLIIIKDLEGRYMLVNRAYEKAFKVTNESIRNKSVYDVLSKHEADIMIAEDSRALELGGPISTEVEVKQADGIHTHLIVKFPLKDDRGNAYAVGSISTDITERKRMETELAKVQRLESMGLLAGGIAHDFNNILSSILLNVTGALLAVDEDSNAAQKLAEAEKAVLRAKGLTKQLLTFAKGGSPVKKVVVMPPFLHDAVTLPMSGSNSKLELHLSDDLWDAEIDENQIHQVINNVIINACQAMPEGGLINVRCENFLCTEEFEMTLPAGRYIKLAMRDNGPGIPEEIRQKVFDPFFTTKPNGNGLGLSIAFSIVKKHGGRMFVSSNDGAGTEFIIYLPAKAQEEPLKQVRITALGGHRKQNLMPGNSRVLIMDDDEQLRTILGELLGVKGFDVELCADGLSAISKYRDAIINGRRFDAVVLDLTVPGGMGGKETMEELLSIDPDVRAIASSGYEHEDTLSRYLDIGFKACISKPFSVVELSEILQELKSA